MVVCTCSVNPIRINKTCKIHGEKKAFYEISKIGTSKKLMGEKVAVGKGKGGGKSKKDDKKGDK